MALIRIETNVALAERSATALSRGARGLMAGVLGGVDGDVRVEIAHGQRMRMAVSEESVVHVKIMGVDFPKERSRELYSAFCPLIRESVDVDENRIYIVVISTRNSMWRVSGDVATGTDG